MVNQDQAWIPGPILLLGAPGVGKGTQAQLLMQQWKIPQISTGDIFRLNIREGTGVGKRVEALVAAGKYVPDEMTNAMVAGRLNESDCANGYVLDGFPRTLTQAAWLDIFLAQGEATTSEQKRAFLLQRMHSSPPPLNLPVVAVSIRVRYDELLRRITGRRTGPVSKRIYNIYTNPPRMPGVCDVDGETLVQRPDDTEEVFAERMRVFEEQTAPVIAHYRELGRFEEVDGEQPVHVVTEQLLAALRRLRGN